MESFPAATPAWLLRQPVLLARWLAWRERRQRARRGKSLAMMLAALTAMIAFPIAATRIDAGSWITALHDYWLLALVVVTAHVAMTVAGKHRAAVEDWSASWLASAPLSSGSVRFSLWIDAIALLLIQYLIVCGLLLLLAAMSGNFSAASAPFKALSAGLPVGWLMGLWMLRRRRREQLEGSRYAPSMAPRDAVLRPSDRALSRWPIAHAMASARPENARVLFMVAATMGVSAGTSAARGLAILLFWAIAGYLVSLLRGGVTVAFAAATWLRPTPIGFVTFAWPLARRALLHQFLGTAVVGAGAMLSGSWWLLVIGVAAVWLLMVAVVFAVALWMSHRNE